jgi:hypothetical protein
MAFTVVYDAHVLYPTRCGICWSASARPAWCRPSGTNEILDEMLQALSRNGPTSRRTSLTAFAS